MIRAVYVCCFVTSAVCAQTHLTFLEQDGPSSWRVRQVDEVDPAGSGRTLLAGLQVLDAEITLRGFTASYAKN